MQDQTIGLASSRTVGFADYGIPGATAVLWCHGGPGSRLEPAYLRRVASEAGLRIIGIDRPGYGLSAPQPGREQRRTPCSSSAPPRRGLMLVYQRSPRLVTLRETSSSTRAALNRRAL